MTRHAGRPLLRDAHAGRFAVPAFNVSNLETTQAIIAAAEAAAAPVILQVSPGAIAYAGYDALTRLVMDVAERAAVPVVVHLDHCRDSAVVERAIADGYDSVMFDGSVLPLPENIAMTRRLVALARDADDGIAMEAELGRIGGREDTDAATAIAERTTPDEAAAFVEATDIDVLAPNLGNLHRMPDDSVTLDLEQIRAISDATGRPIALHGGSGIDQAQLRAAVAAGIGKVNVSSRVSRALAAGIRATWAERPDELDLRRFLGAGREAIVAMAAAYFELTGISGRAGALAGMAPGVPVPAWSAHDAEPE
jgi:ketose-bisphosphate aldolase